MKIYILKTDWNECPAGTRFFFQDGMYFFKTLTEQERWLTVDEFETIKDKFREATALELLYHCNLTT